MPSVISFCSVVPSEALTEIVAEVEEADISSIRYVFPSIVTDLLVSEEESRIISLGSGLGETWIVETYLTLFESADFT